MRMILSTIMCSVKYVCCSMCDNHFGNPLGQLDWRRRPTGLAKKLRKFILLDPEEFRAHISKADEAAQAAKGPAADQGRTATAAACVPADEPVRASGDAVSVASPKRDEWGNPLTRDTIKLLHIFNQPSSTAGSRPHWRGKPMISHISKV